MDVTNFWSRGGTTGLVGGRKPTRRFCNFHCAVIGWSTLSKVSKRWFWNAKILGPPSAHSKQIQYSRRQKQLMVKLWADREHCTVASCEWFPWTGWTREPNDSAASWCYLRAPATAGWEVSRGAARHGTACDRQSKAVYGIHRSLVVAVEAKNTVDCSVKQTTKN